MQRAGANPIAPTRNRSHSNGLGRNCKWSPEEDALLAKIVQGCESVNWKAAEAQFPGKTSQQIFERWTKVLDPTLLKGSWTREEDETIITFVRTYGCRSWTKLAKMLPGRIGKQCRERWRAVDARRRLPAPAAARAIRKQLVQDRNDDANSR